MDEGAFRRVARECALYRGLLNLNDRTEPEPFLRDALQLIVEAVQIAVTRLPVPLDLNLTPDYRVLGYANATS